MCARAIALVVFVPGLDLVDLRLNALILDEMYSHLDRTLVLRAPFRASPMCLHIRGPSALFNAAERLSRYTWLAFYSSLTAYVIS